MLTNLHVLNLPESEKHNFGIMSVCVSKCLLPKVRAEGWEQRKRKKKSTKRITKEQFPLFTFSYTKYTKRKYCNRQNIRTRDFDESTSFRPPRVRDTIWELCLSVSEHDNSKTIRATGMKF
ncbi:hypothetical protein AVEN_200531-1, partial [Araneus ventricosus]